MHSIECVITYTHIVALVTSESLFIYSNSIEGVLPAQMGLLRLRQLQAQSNRLEGQIPEDFWENRGMKILRLENNNLNGKLSSNVGNLQDLEDFRLTNNKFTGELPTSLFNIQNLRECLMAGVSIE